MRLLTCCNATMDQSARANFCCARDQSLDDPKDGPEKGVLVARQFRMAQPWVEHVDCDVELGDGMVAGDVADCEDFEKFADVVAVVHTGLLGVVQGVEDLGRLAFREL